MIEINTVLCMILFSALGNRAMTRPTTPPFSIGPLPRAMRPAPISMSESLHHRFPVSVQSLSWRGACSTSFRRAMTPTEAFHADAEPGPLIDAAGQIAVEIIAPAPPGIPRLIPGQRIDMKHLRRLVANRDAVMLVLDPVDIDQQVVRVVRS